MIEDLEAEQDVLVRDLVDARRRSESMQGLIIGHQNTPWQTPSKPPVTNNRSRVGFRIGFGIGFRI